ncbi:unnamed protein product [Chrysoparadoxa australica]
MASLSCRRLGRLHDFARRVTKPRSFLPPPSAAAAAAGRCYTSAAQGAFPSLVVTASSITAKGPFAETQATYMNPDDSTVNQLDELLEKGNMGVVAHFYMDAELQGTLSALQWPHVCVADSLAMGDAAVSMAKGGATSIACLGVDFMAESVRATLDGAGFPDVPVYRLSEGSIGCSLAEAAERLEYAAWLTKAAQTPNSLHVVYINTSLVTKARSQSVLPTITCTSSNVLRTVLQAFAEVPGLSVWYGPDTYMGRNLHSMFEKIAQMPDDEIRALHPEHNRETLQNVLSHFHYFKQGSCIVHHMFGDDVVHRVRESYADAYHTAHLEVPGEMFELAMEAQSKGRGVVGSTSNILNFITEKASAAAKSGGDEGAGVLQFVLGTEAGMTTSIVKKVQKCLKEEGAGEGTAVEIVFPVASEALTATGDDALRAVPGVSGGEGCSTAGGCATCPFMKMNDLDSLVSIAEAVQSGETASLARYLPQRRAFLSSSGEDQTALGVVPIMSMRHLMQSGELGEELRGDIRKRHAAAS